METDQRFDHRHHLEADMKLLARYLAAVRQSLFFVRTAERDDIIHELEEELQSQFDDRRAELGRHLSEAEEQAILQKFGHPLLVAGRYRPNRGTFSFGAQIVGPELFPLYALVLSLNVLLATLILAALAVFGTKPITAGTIALHILFQATLVTIIFASVDIAARRSFRSGWSAETIPQPRDRRRIPRSSSVGNIIFLTFFLSVWVDLPWFPSEGIVRGFVFDPGATWNTFQRLFYFPLLLLAGISACLAVVNLVRPHWSRRRLFLKAAIDAATASMLAVTLVRTWREMKPIWLRHAVDHVATSQSEVADAWVNASVYFLFFFALCIAVGELISAVNKLARWNDVPNGVVATAE
jgi:hypothetical protein